MTDSSSDHSPSRPLPVPASSSSENHERSRSPGESSVSRATSNARLNSPLPSRPSPRRSREQSQQPVTSREGSRAPTPLAGWSGSGSSLPASGESALARALQGEYGGSPPRRDSQTSPIGSLTPSQAGAGPSSRLPRSTYGSFDQHLSARNGSPAPFEDPNIVRKHLPGLSENTSPNLGAQTDGKASPSRPSLSKGKAPSDQAIAETPPTLGIADDEFSSLRMQGGDITRGVYQWWNQKNEESQGRGSQSRRKSFHVQREQPDSGFNISKIREPQGFRRHHLSQPPGSPAPGRASDADPETHPLLAAAQPPRVPFTSSFMEFLSLYGHFAGEDLEGGDDDDDDDLFSDDFFSAEGHLGDEAGATSEEDREFGEDSALLTPGRRRRRRARTRLTGSRTPFGATLLLLKSFVGTGVLFLPRAFLNGGMVFSTVVLLTVASVSYYCFILLVKTRLKHEHSFGDMGALLWGWPLRILINISLVLSQLGFASAYMVFTAENIQAMVLALTDCKTHIEIKYLILVQWAIFLPVCLVRKIDLLQLLAVVADVLIVIGIVYLFGCDVETIRSPQWQADIAYFNSRNWTLFMGTAIFTFEGIGLIIPIQSSMVEPQKFPRILGGVMIFVMFLFTIMGAASYLAFGSRTKTVVLLNLPQDNPFVNTVQGSYAIAIMLSTPLQIYPAIEIATQELFRNRTGRRDRRVKWQKNLMRATIVTGCALIAWVGANDLDKFVSIVGSLACIPLVYIYPPMLHYRAIAEKRFHKISDITLCVIGFVGMAYTSALTIKGWIHGGAEAPPGYCNSERVSSSL